VLLNWKNLPPLPNETLEWVTNRKTETIVKIQTRQADYVGKPGESPTAGFQQGRNRRKFGIVRSGLR